MNKILFVIFILFALSACSTTYTARDLEKKGNANLPMSFEKYWGKLTISKIKRIAFDKKKKRVYISLAGKVKLPLMPEKNCDKMQISLQPYLFKKEFRIKGFNAEGIDCLVSESIDTFILNLLKDVFMEDDIKIFTLSGIQSWLVDDVVIEEEGIVIKLSLF